MDHSWVIFNENRLNSRSQLIITHFNIDKLATFKTMRGRPTVPSHTLGRLSYEYLTSLRSVRGDWK